MDVMKKCSVKREEQEAGTRSSAWREEETMRMKRAHEYEWESRRGKKTGTLPRVARYPRSHEHAYLSRDGASEFERRFSKTGSRRGGAEREKKEKKKMEGNAREQRYYSGGELKRMTG